MSATCMSIRAFIDITMLTFVPMGRTKVNMVFSMYARMLMHVAYMRAAADAQWEIRGLTEEMLTIAEEWCPITFEHYNEHMKNRKNRLAP